MIYILPFISVIFLQSLAYDPPNNYCEQTFTICGKVPYCTDGKQFATKNKTFEYDKYVKDKIVGILNYMRNVVACGDPPLVNDFKQNLPKGKKMQEIAWSEELEWAAQYYVFTTQTCIETPNFPYPFLWKVEFPLKAEFKYFHAITKHFSKIFAKYKELNILKILEYTEEENKTGKNIENSPKTKRQVDENQDFIDFVNLLSDKISLIGCASIEKAESTFTTCVVDSKLNDHSQIYEKSDESGSGCETLNDIWKCLCGTSEKATEAPVTNLSTEVSEITNIPVAEVIEIERNPIISIKPTCPTRKPRIIKFTSPSKRIVLIQKPKSTLRYVKYNPKTIVNVRRIPKPEFAVPGPFFCEDDRAANHFAGLSIIFVPIVIIISI